MRAIEEVGKVGGGGGDEDDSRQEEEGGGGGVAICLVSLSLSLGGLNESSVQDTTCLRPLHALTISRPLSRSPEARPAPFSRARAS